MKIFKIFISLVSLFTLPAIGAPAPEISAYRVSGGMAVEFPNYKLESSNTPTILAKPQSLTPEQQRIARIANKVFKNEQSLAILIIDRGNIIYESYRAPATENTAQFSWSMSKSLTAYTIGQLYCSGKIDSLNDQAKKYAPVLTNTVYGDATVKNLLTMSSGAKEGAFYGSAYFSAGTSQWVDQRSGKISGLEVLRKFNATDIEPGKEFRYLANDTQSLAVVADSVGGFIKSFETYIWDQIGAESPGYWLLDREGAAIAAAGFSATIRDWARLAIYSIKMQKSGSKCINQFMIDATTQQLPNKQRIGIAFEGYGYQTWVSPKFGNRKSYWWVGYGGQRVGVDPEKERIIVVSSVREDYMVEVYKLFEEVQRMK